MLAAVKEEDEALHTMVLALLAGDFAGVISCPFAAQLLVGEASEANLDGALDAVLVCFHAS